MIGHREGGQIVVTDGRLLYFLKQGYKLDLPINFIKTYKQYLKTQTYRIVQDPETFLASSAPMETDCVNTDTIRSNYKH